MNPTTIQRGATATPTDLLDETYLPSTLVDAIEFLTCGGYLDVTSDTIEAGVRVVTLDGPASVGRDRIILREALA